MYPPLPNRLQQALRTIEPSLYGNLFYYPCDVTLQDGRNIRRVYLVEESAYIRVWGVYPNEDAGKQEVLLSEVLSVRESASRIPARFANELYMHGESGMGYYMFIVTFTGGARQMF